MGNNAGSRPTTSVDADIVNPLRKNTPFTYAEAEKIVERYLGLDNSPQGQVGIKFSDCLMMPEFTGNVFSPDTISFYQDPKTKNIHPRNFLKICTMFCRRTPAQTKKEFLFDLFDVDKQKLLTHDAMFRIFKLFYSNAISDDHILALVYSALRHPILAKDGEVTRNEFLEMVPDSEIQERMSIDFAFVPESPE